jgi:hypothetical protein
MRAQDLAVEHARQHDVVGKFSLAGTLRARIHLAKRFPDNLQGLSVFISVLSH